MEHNERNAAAEKFARTLLEALAPGSGATLDRSAPNKALETVDGFKIGDRVVCTKYDEDNTHLAFGGPRVYFDIGWYGTVKYFDQDGDAWVKFDKSDIADGIWCIKTSCMQMVFEF